MSAFGKFQILVWVGLVIKSNMRVSLHSSNIAVVVSAAFAEPFFFSLYGVVHMKAKTLT